jgi:hypothetical protein
MGTCQKSFAFSGLMVQLFARNKAMKRPVSFNNMGPAFSGRGSELGSSPTSLAAGVASGGLFYSRNQFLLLKVQAEYFRAGAIWQKLNGVWSCTRAASVLRWMRGMNQNQAGLCLLKMGARYEWTPRRVCSKNIRDPVLFAGATVTRNGSIPSADVPSYEEKYQRHTSPAARTSPSRVEMDNEGSSSHRSATRWTRLQAQGAGKSPRNRRGFYSRH